MAALVSASLGVTAPYQLTAMDRMRENAKPKRRTRTIGIAGLAQEVAFGFRRRDKDVTFIHSDKPVSKRRARRLRGKGL
jgi:hypothetical protein